jgi:hypothetical protein
VNSLLGKPPAELFSSISAMIAEINLTSIPAGESSMPENSAYFIFSGYAAKRREE